MIEIFNILVTALGILMSLAHFPQAVKIIKRKSAKDVSLITYFIFMIGSYVWLVYGLLLNQIHIILTFIIAVVGTTSVFLLVLKYK